jgi:hypothetical protein
VLPAGAQGGDDVVVGSVAAMEEYIAGLAWICSWNCISGWPLQPKPYPLLLLATCDFGHTCYFLLAGLWCDLLLATCDFGHTCYFLLAGLRWDLLLATCDFGHTCYFLLAGLSVDIFSFVMATKPFFSYLSFPFPAVLLFYWFTIVHHSSSRLTCIIHLHWLARLTCIVHLTWLALFISLDLHCSSRLTCIVHLAWLALFISLDLHCSSWLTCIVHLAFTFTHSFVSKENKRTVKGKKMEQEKQLEVAVQCKLIWSSRDTPIPPQPHAVTVIQVVEYICPCVSHLQTYDSDPHQGVWSTIEFRVQLEFIDQFSM